MSKILIIYSPLFYFRRVITKLAMGGTQSTTAVNQLSETISNIAMSSVQSCEVSASQSQTMVINNSGFKLFGNYKLEQKSDIDVKCFSDIQKQVDLQNKIIAAIAQSSSSQGVALLGAFGKDSASATANLQIAVRNNINMQNIQRSYTEIRQNQSVEISNSGVVLFEQVELTQGSKIFAAATLKEVDRAGIFNAISSHIDQSASAKQENPLDFIGKALSGLADVATKNLFLFIFIIVFGLFGAGIMIKILGHNTNQRVTMPVRTEQTYEEYIPDPVFNPQEVR